MADVPASGDHGDTFVSPWDLITTHKLRKTPREMSELQSSIESKGFIHIPGEPVAFVVLEGKTNLVDGHHRARIARSLGLAAIPARRVQLPYKGYRTEADLFDWDR